MMGVGPKAFRHDPGEAILDRPYGGARGEAQTIGHPEDVGVHGDHGFAEGGIQNDVRRLAAHPGKGFEGFAFAGDLASMVAHQDLAGLADMARLGVVEADAGDEGLQLLLAQAQHGARVRGGLEKRPRRLIDGPVRRLRGEQHGDEELKGASVAKLGGGPRVALAKTLEDRLAVFERHPYARRLRRAGSGQRRAAPRGGPSRARRAAPSSSSRSRARVYGTAPR